MIHPRVSEDLVSSMIFEICGKGRGRGRIYRVLRIFITCVRSVVNVLKGIKLYVISCHHWIKHFCDGRFVNITCMGRMILCKYIDFRGKCICLIKYLSQMLHKTKCTMRQPSPLSQMSWQDTMEPSLRMVKHLQVYMAVLVQASLHETKLSNVCLQMSITFCITFLFFFIPKKEE